MASATTTTHHQMEKEQLFCWPENEELEGLSTSGDKLFDEYVTFDPDDLLRDIQSPSALLDSLDDTLAGSFDEHSIFTTAPVTLEDVPKSMETQSSQVQDSKGLLDWFEPADQLVPGGSISDSDLLRLEGITLQSPNGHITAPSSPLLPLQSSPTKRSRLVNSVYATFRRATHHERPQRTHTAVSAMEMFQRDDMGVELSDISADPFEYIPDGLDLKPTTGPIDSHGLPLSPPLTGKIPYSGTGGTQYADNSNLPFITGTFEDPFCDEIMAPPPPPTGGTDPSTPLNTPALKGDEFFFSDAGVMQTINPSSNQIRRPMKQQQQRNTSSAEWPMEGILTDDSSSRDHWSSSDLVYIADSGGVSTATTIQSPNWWDDAAASLLDEQAPTRPSQGGGGSGAHNRNHNNNISGGGGGNENNTIDDLPDLSYEFTSDLSGLMIHMPQPRQPQAAVLMADIPEQLVTPTRATHHQQPSPFHHHHPPSSSSAAYNHRGRYADHHSQQTPHHHHRRPQPRAPSSGARHHHRQNPHGLQQQPPTPRRRRSSSSSGRPPHPQPPSSSSRRSASSGSRCWDPEDPCAVSPSPSTPRHHHGYGGYSHRRQHGEGDDLSVRRQRSWSSRRGGGGGGEARNHSGGSLSSGGGGVRFGSVGPESPGGDGGGGGGGGGGGKGGFVNFTPSDKNILMTGVAPSGSSKTKARREKEAAERRRKLSEAAVKAVQAAGGDVEKLVREGFMV